MRVLIASALVAAATAVLPSAAARPPVAFAVIGDSGTGDRMQYDVAQQMAAVRERRPFDFVIMLGDNIYGRQEPADFVQKFERPYKRLLDAGVRFYAALGNHDNERNRFYQPFNMGGNRYYSYAVNNVRFFVLDSDSIDPKQRTWIEEALQAASEEWKICYFHHPLYSDGGRHGSQVDLRVVLEPLFVKYGVNVVFAGHDHVYERIKPQKGITYFVAGSAGQLRKGDLHPSDLTAAAFDQDSAFIVVAIAGNELTFNAISRTGQVVDSGVIHREVRP